MQGAILVEAGLELDAAVAKAIGLRGGVVEHGCFYLFQPETLRDFFRDTIGNAVSKFEAEAGYGPNGNLYHWSPSCDANAAFDAAEKCGLFDRESYELYKAGLWFCCNKFQAEPPSGRTPSLAICAAILAVLSE